MEVITIYKAKDGETFNSRSACVEYEQSLKKDIRTQEVTDEFADRFTIQLYNFFQDSIAEYRSRPTRSQRAEIFNCLADFFKRLKVAVDDDEEDAFLEHCTTAKINEKLADYYDIVYSD